MIAHSYLDKINNQESLYLFVKKRFARIWPLHFFMMVLFIPFAAFNLIFHIDLGDRFSLFSFLTNATFLQAFGLHTDATWNQPAWSIAVEFYTYIAFGVLVLLCPRKSIVKASLSIALISMLILYYNSSMSDIYRWPMFRCTYSFFLGVVAYKLSFRVNFKPFCEVLVVIGLFFSFSMTVINGAYTYLYPLLFFMVILIFANEQGVVSKFLSLSFFRRMGELSFSIYLTHTWIITASKAVSIVIDKIFGFNFMPSETERVFDFGLGYWNDLIYLPYVLLIIFVASLTFKYIEKPAQQYLLNKFFRETGLSMASG